MKNRLKIYLAGAMSGLSYNEMNEWRSAAKNLISEYADMKECPVQVVNPVEFYNFENVLHKTEREIMTYDLTHVRSSDILLVNINKLNTSVGTCIEIYQAYIQGTPILAFGTQQEYEILHPWLKEMIHRYETRLLDIIDYIRDFYII